MIILNIYSNCWTRLHTRAARIASVVKKKWQIYHNHLIRIYRKPKKWRHFHFYFQLNYRERVCTLSKSIKFLHSNYLRFKRCAVYYSRDRKTVWFANSSKMYKKVEKWFPCPVKSNFYGPRSNIEHLHNCHVSHRSTFHTEKLISQRQISLILISVTVMITTMWNVDGQLVTMCKLGLMSKVYSLR